MVGLEVPVRDHQHGVVLAGQARVLGLDRVGTAAAVAIDHRAAEAQDVATRGCEERDAEARRGGGPQSESAVGWMP